MKLATRPSKLCGFCIFHIWTIVQLFQKYATCFFLSLRCMLCICVFVYLHFCICLFGIWEYHLWYPWIILFSKICHMLGVSGTSLYTEFVYFVFVFCIVWHREISFLISLNNPLFKNMAHVGSFWHFVICLSLIHIWRCRRLLTCRSRWSPYH